MQDQPKRPEGAPSASFDSRAITVPAEYADDFRAAIVEEIAQTSNHARQERKELAERRYAHDPNADITADDLAGSIRLVAADARLLVEVGPEGDDEIQVDVDGEGTLAHVFETMARHIVGPRLADVGTPIELDYAATLAGLIAQYRWAIDCAAECHEQIGKGT